MYHEHPLRILRYSVKNIWLLVFPLIRGFHAVVPDVDRLYRWFKGAWFDILILGIILLFGYIRWYFSWIIVTDNSIIHTQGVFVKLKKIIPYKNLSSVTVERSFYLRTFGGMRLYFVTSAGVFSRSDMTVMVTKRVCAEVVGKIPNIRIENKRLRRQNTAMMSVLMFSVFFSSSLSGAVYVAALFFKGGDIIQDMISMPLSRITEETAKLTDNLIVKIPAAAVGVGMFFIAMWFVSFLLNFVRYSGFALEIDADTVQVSCGAFTRRYFLINRRFINYTDLRQNLIMKLFRVIAVNISCAGYGSGKKSFPVILPMKKEENFIGKGAESAFRPPIIAFWQYIWQPAIAAVSVPAASYILEIYVAGYSEFAFFLVIMTEIPALWMIAVKLTALLTSGIYINGNEIVLRYSRGIRFHTIIADRSRLVKISITQSPFQRLRKKCSIGFFFNGENNRRHYIKALSLSDAEKINSVLDKM